MNSISVSKASSGYEPNFAVNKGRSVPHIAILGAGPAGLGAAWQLAKAGKAKVTVIEQHHQVGGNAGSFELDGIQVDYGSHRLHPACDPQILRDLHDLLGTDLLRRPRHGRILLRGRWIHFPLKPVDLLGHLPPAFAVGVARDSLRKLLIRSNGHSTATFKSVLEHGLGTTICKDFYFPYAQKIWGLPPDELSQVQAQRRVSAGSMGTMVRKVLRAVPGIKSPEAGRFFYPRFGYGQISKAISVAAQEAGVELRLNTTVSALHLGNPQTLELESGGATYTLQVDQSWSTIPISLLAKITRPRPEPAVINASSKIQYRAMVLIYLVLETAQWTPYDAHYFPEEKIKLTRLSEPKNYSGRTEPTNRTVLCGELPCSIDDDVWRASDHELAQMVSESLAHCGLPLNASVLKVVTRRLSHAYPIYRRGYEEHFSVLDDWSSNLEGVLTFGRQGLFAHDNTHHALAMAYAAVDCLRWSGEFDHARWREHRTEFNKHVVED